MTEESIDGTKIGSTNTAHKRLSSQIHVLHKFINNRALHILSLFFQKAFKAYMVIKTRGPSCLQRKSSSILNVQQNSVNIASPIISVYML